VRGRSQVRGAGFPLFRATGAIIPGSGRADPEKCDVEVIESDPKADAEMFEVSGGKRPKADSNHLFGIINLISFYTTLGAISFNI
jgi:hypothetical protein